ncbi:MAG: type II toxin-antitoxin system PrlF family antitoxin [Lentisphaerae bacterium]|nr:type II toxin-antitoxin system PrlF family antitoxin [Lentisphaerota bacterium]
MIISTLTSKGQTTIPKSVRDALHLSTNDKIAYEIHDDKFIIYPLSGDITSLRGTLKVSEKPMDFKDIRKNVENSRSERAVGKVTCK